MPLLARDDFLEKLETEASYQANLNQYQILPEQLRGLGRLVIKHSWQTIAIISFISAVLLYFLELNI